MFAWAVHDPVQSALHLVVQVAVVETGTHVVVQWSSQQAPHEDVADPTEAYQATAEWDAGPEQESWEQGAGDEKDEILRPRRERPSRQTEAAPLQLAPAPLPPPGHPSGLRPRRVPRPRFHSW